MKFCLRKLGTWTSCAVIYWQCRDFVATTEQVLRGRKNQGDEVRLWVRNGGCSFSFPSLALVFTSLGTKNTIPLCWALYCLYHELAVTEYFQAFVVFTSLQLPLLMESKQTPDIALMGGVFPSPFHLQPS